MEDVVRRAHEAMQARSWDDLRFLLHPYLHWTSRDGRDPPLWPTSVEVRDDQIYRWQEPN